MVLAQAVEFDVSHDHHLAIALAKERIVDNCVDVALVTTGQR